MASLIIVGCVTDFREEGLFEESLNRVKRKPSKKSEGILTTCIMFYYRR